MKRYIYLSQDRKCAHCRTYTDIFDIDHKVPYSITQNNHISNLQALCPTCHARKSRKERIYIVRYKKYKHTRTPVCWECKHHVSPYFWNEKTGICNTCNSVEHKLRKLKI